MPIAGWSRSTLAWSARVTAYIFIVGLLVGLSVLSAWVAAEFYGEPFKFSAASDYVDFKVACVWIGFAGAALVLSWRVDINAFSTHLDRKSTRLNSSHVAISYAVFCLKKKIN